MDGGVFGRHFRLDDGAVRGGQCTSYLPMHLSAHTPIQTNHPPKINHQSNNRASSASSGSWTYPGSSRPSSPSSSRSSSSAMPGKFVLVGVLFVCQDTCIYEYRFHKSQPTLDSLPSIPINHSLKPTRINPQQLHRPRRRHRRGRAAHHGAV